MLNKRKRSEQAGFSLIETAIATVVLAIGLLALGQLLAVAMNQNAMSRTVSVGIEVAQGKLEELRTAYNAGLESGVTSVDLAPGAHGAESVNLPSGYGTSTRTYLVSWTVTNLIGVEKTVEVTAQPQAGVNFLNRRSVSITSHFAP